MLENYPRDTLKLLSWELRAYRVIVIINVIYADAFVRCSREMAALGALVQWRCEIIAVVILARCLH